MTDSGAVVVGAGLMGTWHAHALRAAGLSVLAIVDSQPDRGAALARRHRALATTHLAEALERRPFAVHVCTPADSHVEIARASAAAGAHCLIEKPFAPDADAARRILGVASEHHVLACPVHQFLFQRGVRRAQKQMESLRLLHLDFVACSAGAAIGGDSLGKRARLALDILPHPLSLMRRLTGVSLDSARWQVMTSAAGEVRVGAVIGDVTVGILISASGRPTRNTARLVGANGTLHVDLFHGFATLESSHVSRARKITQPFTASAATMASAAANLARRAIRGEPAYPGLRELVSAFHAAARAGAESPIPADETIDVAEASERLAVLIAADPSGSRA